MLNMMLLFIKKIIDEYSSGTYGKDFKCIGPCEANIYKMDDSYRQVIYIKAKALETLIAIKDRVENVLENETEYENCFISFDFNPLKNY